MLSTHMKQLPHTHVSNFQSPNDIEEPSFIKATIKQSNPPGVQIQNTPLSHAIFENIRRIRPTFLKEYLRTKTIQVLCHRLPAGTEDAHNASVVHLDGHAQSFLSLQTIIISTATE